MNTSSINTEQIKSLVRSLVSTFGGVIAGFFVGKGWFTSDQVMSVITSETFIGLAASGIVAGWGFITHSEKNAVAVVADIAANPASPVKGIIVEPTPAGQALAMAIPAQTIVPAGTTAASAMAKPV
jgi:hypothetical protein